MNSITKKIAILTLTLTVFVIGVLAGYYWARITIPVEIREPLEITSYPEIISFYAGENKTFPIIITNHASVNYSVTLEFALNDTEYQEAYVTFSNIAYIVKPGENTVEAWITVSADAPPTDLTLTVDFTRAAPSP